MKSGNPKQALTTCCAAHTLHDGLSDLTYVLLPLLAHKAKLQLHCSLASATWALTPCSVLLHALGTPKLTVTR